MISRRSPSFKVRVACSARGTTSSFKRNRDAVAPHGQRLQQRIHRHARRDVSFGTVDRQPHRLLLRGSQAASGARRGSNAARSTVGPLAGDERGDGLRGDRRQQDAVAVVAGRDDVAVDRGAPQVRPAVVRARPQSGPRFDQRERAEHRCDPQRNAEQRRHARSGDAHVEVAFEAGCADQQPAVVARHEVYLLRPYEAAREALGDRQAPASRRRPDAPRCAPPRERRASRRPTRRPRSRRCRPLRNRARCECRARGAHRLRARRPRCVRTARPHRCTPRRARGPSAGCRRALRSQRRPRRAPRRRASVRAPASRRGRAPTHRRRCGETLRTARPGRAPKHRRSATCSVPSWRSCASTPVRSRSSSTKAGYARSEAAHSASNAGSTISSEYGASIPAPAHEAARAGSPRSYTVTDAPRFASSYATPHPMRPGADDDDVLVHGLHARVDGALAALRRDPRDDLVGIHDVARFAVHAVGEVDLQAALTPAPVCSNCGS